MEKLHRTIAATIGLGAFACGLTYGGEQAVTKNAGQLYDFPVERVHALVQLYREGGDYQTIATPMLVKMGQPARMELLAMRHAATDADESRIIGEILAYYSEPAQPPSKSAGEQSRSKQRTSEHKDEKPTPKNQIVQQSPPVRTARKPSTSAIAFGAMGITNPLQPSATRF
jgi:hypothetical protein